MYYKIIYLVAHQPILNTTRAISMMILSIPTTTPAVSEVNHSSAASFSMFVTSSTPVCSIVASIKLGSDVPVWATSARACRLVYIVSRTWISSCTSSNLSEICEASASYRSWVYEPMQFGMYDRKSRKHQLLPLLAMPVSAGGYHQQRIIDTAKGRKSFSTSSGSCLTIILYAMPAAMMMAKSAASAMHI